MTDTEFAAALEQWRPKMVDLAGYMIHHRPDLCAEDIVQEAYLRVWKKRVSFRGHSAFRTWLHQCVVNQTLMFLRIKTVHIESVDGSPYPTDGPNPEELVLSRERVENVISGLMQLNPRRRRIFLLYMLECNSRYASGRKETNIAQMLGCPEPTVHSNVTRARDRLRHLLGKVAA